VPPKVSTFENMKEDERTPIKRTKTTPGKVEEQAVLIQERAQELVGTRFTFRVVTIDGGKTLNVELPIKRLVDMRICEDGGD
jgi:hypothetical protein